MKKLIAFVIALVTYAIAYNAHQSKKADREAEDLKIQEAKKAYLEIQVIALQRQLSEALLSEDKAMTYWYTTQMQKQTQILNNIYEQV